MSGRYLLDTRILIALFANEMAVKGKLAQASEVFVPSIAVGELYYGAWNMFVNRKVTHLIAEK
jgi:tRNA(fMet)-specific endonuclease VapC